ncbi:MAG: ferrous iron transport protein B [Puniceicoccales bacterium]|jgi:ferrous iron transport protein B|nr:ferrous iron transport protein B [Puniceicoccales bacterium]
MCATPNHPPRIALIGNPNTGKTSLFNALTGLRQRIGNYPGVTVARKSGTLLLQGGVRAELLDLPGLYSLAASSLDERIVIDVLCGHLDATPPPDVILCVADATNLLRNLFLASQVAELGIPMMLVLNQADVARKRGMAIDTAKLSERLGGIPVVLASAWHGEGIHDIRAALSGLLEKKTRMTRIVWHEGVPAALDILRDGLSRVGAVVPPEPELQRILFDSSTPVLDRLRCPPDTVAPLVAAARERVRHAGFNPLAAEPVLHYGRLHGVLDGVVSGAGPAQTFTRHIDKVLLHRVFGTLIFFVSMAVVFASVFWLAKIPQSWVEAGFEWIGAVVGPSLEAYPVLQSLVTQGIINGVGAFMVFLPQILILFFFIALLEDTGYMARAAFLMDKLFSWCGLNGKSFVPMLSGFACAIPGVMATRTIEDPKSRIATIFIIPLMSCSARLPVYTLMISAFLVPQIGPWRASFVMVGMYLVGLVVAVPTAWVLTRSILKTRPQPFVLEMPRYQIPKARDVLWRMWQSGAEFVKRAGTIIFAITVIVWALLYFPHSEEVAAKARAEFTVPNGTGTDGTDAAAALEHHIEAALVEDSYLGRFGKFVQPVFDPAGFDWKITIGVLASFPAREVIVSTLGITYSLGGEATDESTDLRTAMAKSVWTSGPRIGTPIFTPPVVFGIMLFFALCSQCGATLATITKEANWRWAAAAFVFMTTLAWLAAVACYQVGSWFA